jgi:hypothetical protein
MARDAKNVFYQDHAGITKRINALLKRLVTPMMKIRNLDSSSKEDLFKNRSQKYSKKRQKQKLHRVFYLSRKSLLHS